MDLNTARSSRRYSTLRSSAEGQRKNRVPREAVYCYIDAKYSLCLRGDGGQSLWKAINQVADVKRLVRERDEVPLSTIQGEDLSNIFVYNTPDGYPDRRNPPYGAVFARKVRPESGEDPLTDPHEIVGMVEELNSQESPSLPEDHSLHPDIIVLGEKVIALPVYVEDEHFLFRPFLVRGETGKPLLEAEQGTFGPGFAAVMAAVEWIKLGKMSWGRMLANSLSPLVGGQDAAQSNDT